MVIVHLVQYKDLVGMVLVLVPGGLGTTVTLKLKRKGHETFLEIQPAKIDQQNPKHTH